MYLGISYKLRYYFLRSMRPIYSSSLFDLWNRMIRQNRFLKVKKLENYIRYGIKDNLNFGIFQMMNVVIFVHKKFGIENHYLCEVQHVLIKSYIIIRS